jgi:tripeptidyl-peptidase-1
MRSSSLLLLSVALSLLLSLACASSPVTLESFPSAPSGWVSVGRAAPETNLRLLIAVRQTNLDLLESTLLRVSNPKSADYGQWLSNEAIHSMIAPRAADVAGVMAWLQQHGIDTSAANLQATSNKDFLRVRATVAQAEKLLHTQYFEFTHEARKRSTIRCLAYKVPHHLQSAIDIIGPTVRFPSSTKPRPTTVAQRVADEKRNVAALKREQHHLSKLNKRKHHHSKAKAAAIVPDPSVCLAGPSTLSTTPACLRALYAIGDYTAAKGTNSSVGVSVSQRDKHRQTSGQAKWTKTHREN